MKRLSIILFLAGALLLSGLATAWACTPGGLQPTPLATFSPTDYGNDYGAFARGMAADSRGNLIVSLTAWGQTESDSNVGEVWKVTPNGTKTLLAKMDLTPYGAYMSVALDGCDRVYVAVYDFSADLGLPDSIGSGIFRLDAGVMTRVVSLPPGSWPNGLAFHRGWLYISDATRGAIWRVTVGGGVAAPTSPWFKKGLLAQEGQIGATGIAFKGDTLYAAVWYAGAIVSLPVRSDGTHGALDVLCRRPELKSADGIAFDLRGRLWVATNGTDATLSGGLHRVSADGSVTQLAKNPSWLDYPTSPVFGTTKVTRTTLFVANGSYNNGAPSIISLDAGVAGLPLN